VDSYYNFSNELKSILSTPQSTNNNIHQFNDDLLWNVRNQARETAYRHNYPTPSAQQIQDIDKAHTTIDYWWKGSQDTYNYVASVDDFLNNGFTSLTNWNLDYLFWGGGDFKGKRTSKAVYDEWHPGVFATNYENNQSQVYLEDENGNYPSWLKGADLSYWENWRESSPYEIWNRVFCFGQKSWHGQKNIISFNRFQNLLSKLNLDK
jgi:hypothetical protein